MEDEKEQYEILKSYIERCTKKGRDYHISWLSDGIDLVDDYQGQYDIIFLDIQMKHMDGMSAAEKIRAMDADVVIIFITSTVSYAVQGYAVDALGYVLKPVPFVAFEKLFQKAVERIKARDDKVYIRVAAEDRQMKIDSDQYLKSILNIANALGYDLQLVKKC